MNGPTGGTVGICITNAHIVDPGHCDGRYHLIVHQGRIRSIIDANDPLPASIATTGTKMMDGTGWLVCPGLVDMHVHFREPGQTHKETIATGSAAAAAGGFTAVCTMPNTIPANDHPDTTRWIRERGDAAGLIAVHPAGAISKGLHGEEMTDFRALKAAGAVAVSDDGMPVANDELMTRAMVAAADVGLRVISHCEVPELAAGGAMNRGGVAKSLGVPGIPNRAESDMVERDIQLSKKTGAPVHIAHVSTRESVQAIRAAKDRGVPVTAETAPHYFSLTDTAVENRGTLAKMNPPLRSADDRDAIRQGLSDGTLDAIATDHAPHAADEKALPLADAPFGIVGLETAVPLSLALVRDGVLTLAQWVTRMAVAPSNLLGLSTGIQPGATANLSIIDPTIAYRIDAKRFLSKSRNTPFDGWTMTGRAIGTIIGDRWICADTIP